MSHHVKKVLLLILYLLSFSCENKQKKEKKIKDFGQYIRISENIIGKREYTLVYNIALDSINSWINNKIGSWQYEKIGYSIEIDSLLCFNKERDKLVTALLAKTLDKNYSVDGVHFFYGVKIKDKWCFFKGPSISIPRNGYQKDIHTPLSFSKLHTIAIEELFSGYLKIDEKGQWQVNDEFFSDLTSGAWYKDGYEPKNQEEWDKRYLEIVKENRVKIDTNDYSKMK